MGDAIDDAQGAETAHREAALARAKATREAEAKPATAARNCLACGDEISAMRLRAVPNAKHCIFCQSKAETLARLRAMPGGAR